MSQADDGANVAGCAAFLIFGGAIVIAGACCYHRDVKEASALKVETPQKDENSALLEATYDSDIEDFDKALAKGAKIEDAINKDNQDILMLALSHGRYKMVNYIISNPELSRKIDYNRRDINGHTAKQILELNIEATQKMVDEREKRIDEGDPFARFNRKIDGDYNLGNMKKLLKLIEKEEKIQQQEAKAGKLRSKTSYAFYELMQNNAKQNV